MMVGTQANCIHQYSLNTKIHKFTLRIADEQGMDEFFMALDAAYQTHPDGEIFLMLTDLRPDGIPPFNYTLMKARNFFKHYANIPEMRAAYIYDKSPFLTIIRRFFGLLQLKTQRKFFQGTSESTVEQDALAWLLLDEDKS